MKTYKNDQFEVFACDSYDRIGVNIHSLSIPDERARFAMDLMKCLIGPASLDTHPSAKTLTASDISRTACDVADAAFKAFQDRGWTVAVPDMATLKDEARENRGN